MNSLLLDGLSELKSNFSDWFQNKSKAKRVWRLRQRNPNLLKNFVWEEYSSIMKREGVEKAYRWSSFLFSGWKEQKIRSYSKKIWKEQLCQESDLAVSPFREMLGLIRYLREKKWDVYIVTASPESIIREVISSYSIPKENVIGMRLAEKGGISTPEIIEPYTYGEGKVKALWERIGGYADLSFGDSENDFPLLKSAKRFGVLLDKGNAELVEKCKSINCLIQPVFR